jgi:hypothetical protein
MNNRTDSSLLLNIRGWTRPSVDMNIWRRTIEEARARCGLSRHWRRWRRKQYIWQNNIYYVTQQPNLDLGSFIVEVCTSHKLGTHARARTHTQSRTPPNEWPTRRWGRYRNRTTADLRLRPYSHRDRHILPHTIRFWLWGAGMASKVVRV